MRSDAHERKWWNSAWSVFESETLREARELDMGTEPLGTIAFRLYQEPTRVYTAGTFLLQFEREARRALRFPIVEPDAEGFFRRPEARPRPASPSDAGLEIRDARQGSVEWLLAPYGALEALTTYTPLQVVATVAWLIGSGAQIRAIIRHRGPNARTESHDLHVVTLPDGTRVSVPPGGHLTIVGEGPDRVIELEVGFGE